MKKNKTIETDNSIELFLDAYVDSEKRRLDSYKLIEFMQSIVGFPSRLWGSSIIGFGSYNYISTKATQQGQCPLVAFSPRKKAISLYVFNGNEDFIPLVAQLGKFKMGKACIYIQNLEDINIEILELLIKKNIEWIAYNYK